MTTQTITEFLEARLAEDEQAANLMAKYYPPPWDVYDRGWMARVYGDEPFWEVTRLEQGSWIDNDSPPLGEIIEHVALHDPARVLREVTAKRAIIEAHAAVRDESWKSGADHDYQWCASCGSLDDSPTPFPCAAILALAAVYSDHPDYREEWAPQRLDDAFTSCDTRSR